MIGLGISLTDVILRGGGGGFSAEANFAPVLYTGDGTSSQSITGVGFQPDFVWIKRRDATASHFLFDVNRGAGKSLFTNATNAESSTPYLGSFDSDGFTVIDPATINSANTYVAWCWKAGGTPVTNTDGSITSSVSANQDAGFSVVTYTGAGPSTIGHGLSSTPELIIVKSRGTINNWVVYSVVTGATNILLLESTSPQSASSLAWGNNAPTSSVFSVGSGSGTGSASVPYVAYCFHSVEGYSKIGSFIGNGNTNGPIVTTGFKPRFVLYRNVSGGGNWLMVDGARDPVNPVANLLYPNLDSAEATATNIMNFNEDGFQITRNIAAYNTSGATYLYMAIA